MRTTETATGNLPTDQLLHFSNRADGQTRLARGCSQEERGPIRPPGPFRNTTFAISQRPHSCKLQAEPNPALQGAFRAGPLGLSWNGAATVTPVVSKGFASVLADMAAGAVLHLQHLPSPGYVLYLGMEGTTRVQGASGVTLVLPGQMELRPAAAPLTIHSSLGARGIAVLIPQQKLRIKRLVPGARRSNPSPQAHPINLKPEDGLLSAKLLRDWLAGVAAQVAGGQGSGHIERAGELIAAMLKAAVSEKLMVEERVVSSSIPWYVAAAERQLLDKLSEPVSVVDLARTTGVSPRTLHDGFRKHRGASPMKMLRVQRMQMARKELTEPQGNTSVTDTALKWGFNHLGRFSAYYLAQFGEKPSETLRLSRIERQSLNPARQRRLAG